MSEFHVRVVRIPEPKKHPDSHSLSIVEIDGGYPVVIRTGSFRAGELAVYCPVDSIVPDTAEWHFLAPKAALDANGAVISEGYPVGSVPEKYRRIKAKRLRGVFSMGILAKLPPGTWKVGDNVQDVMAITKWEPRPTGQSGAAARRWYDELPWYRKVTTRLFWVKLLWTLRLRKSGPGDNLVPPPGFPEYTDIEGFRKYKSLFVEGEPVVLTEKIHGSNARFGWVDEKFWVGSHHNFKRRPEKGEPRNWWWAAAEHYGLEAKLAALPGVVFFGEVYGAGVQDLVYDKAAGPIGLRFYDIYSIQHGRYLDYADFVATCDILGLERVPELYRGPWDPELAKLANGPTTIGSNTREGWVIRPELERTNTKTGRTVLKLVGEDYLTRKD